MIQNNLILFLFVLNLKRFTYRL